MPSLYESTAQPGDVSSNDFTTLYNASGLTVPNAGAGTATGNATAIVRSSSLEAATETRKLFVRFRSHDWNRSEMHQP